ncbi:hypothetical protein L0F63_006519 [Massospora cicadina]|nr:hypothetical protein L0F63_006519 [Massospora cicadina]
MHALSVFSGYASSHFEWALIYPRFVVALLFSQYEVSSLVSFALAILAVTKNFICVSDGRGVDCHRCGQDGYVCDGYKGALQVAISGLSNDIVWLVFCAFHIGKAVEVSGFGRRVALHLIALMGKTPLGLGLSFCLAGKGRGGGLTCLEFVLAPFIPSNSARGGGVVAPIVTSVIDVIDSNGAGSESTNAFLILVAAQANLVSSSLFLTGQAPNPLVSEKANHVFHVQFRFMQWLAGNFLPGFATLLIVPPFLLYLIRPKPYDGPALLDAIHRQLAALGPLSWKEWKLVVVLLSCLTFWSTETHTGLNNALIAFVALGVMLVGDVITWEDVSKNTKAWDTLYWLGGFIVIAEQLSRLEVTDWLGNRISSVLVVYSASPVGGAVALGVLYFFSMYLFSSATGHIVALPQMPPRLLIALLAYFGALSCCLTSYSTGALTIYFGQGHIPRGRWFLYGFYLSILYLAIYLTLGMGWWKVLGWW